MQPNDAHVPVAPPRRKRGNSSASNTLKPGVFPGGFRDVFGHLTRRASVDSAISTSDRNAAAAAAPSSHPVPPKRAASSADFATTAADAPPRPRPELKRKVSKVGNKKSDKFFGENLSDCLSDEHIDRAGGGGQDTVDNVAAAAVPDAIDAFVQSNAIITAQTAAKANEPPAKMTTPPSAAAVESDYDVETDASTTTLDRKAEFLMAMLENHNRDEWRYLGREPVDEPIIVPKRKQAGRHICDDDEHIGHHAVHGHGHGDAVDAVATAVAVQPSPKKPDRDMAKYNSSRHNSMTQSDYTSADATPTPTMPSIERPVRHRSSVPREQLPKPPPKPQPHHHHAQPHTAVSPTSTTPRSVKHYRHSRKVSEPVIDNRMREQMQQELLVVDSDADAPNSTVVNGVQLDTILKKCNSSQSFLTPDLMDQIVNKVYGFKMNWDDHENVQGACDDGSTQVAPSSKLKVRKISVIRNKEPTEKPIIEESASEDVVEKEKPSFSIGAQSVQVTANETIVQASPSPVKNIFANLIKPDPITADDVQTNSVEKHVEIRAPTYDHSDDILSVVSAINQSDDCSPTVIKRSDTVIERPKLAVDLTEKLHSKQDGENILHNIYASHQSIRDQFQQKLDAPTPEPAKIVATVAKTVAEPPVVASDVQTVNSSTKPDETTDDESPHQPSTSKPLKSRLLEDVRSLANSLEPRRGSIVDHDQWFNCHRESSDSERESTKRPIDGYDSPLRSYDTRRLFPFGRRERTDSESSDSFFRDESLSSSVEELNDDELAQKLRAMADLRHAEEAEAVHEARNDHSTLLKFISAEKSVSSNTE